MNEEKWNERNNILTDVAQAIATANFAIGHGDYVMPDGTRRTAQEYWDNLTEEQRNKFMQQAYRAYTVFGGYGYQQVMSLAFEEYLDEK